MKRALFYFILTLILGCSMSSNNTINENNMKLTSDNPFFEKSSLYMNYPPFDLIKNKHYVPAFLKGMSDHLNEIELIINISEKPTFDNTIVAMETSGQLLDRVATVFFCTYLS